MLRSYTESLLTRRDSRHLPSRKHPFLNGDDNCFKQVENKYFLTVCARRVKKKQSVFVFKDGEPKTSEMFDL